MHSQVCVIIIRFKAPHCVSMNIQCSEYISHCFQPDNYVHKCFVSVSAVQTVTGSAAII